jgi:hypothetical protein
MHLPEFGSTFFRCQMARLEGVETVIPPSLECARESWPVDCVAGISFTGIHLLSDLAEGLPLCPSHGLEDIVKWACVPPLKALAYLWKRAGLDDQLIVLLCTADFRAMETVIDRYVQVRMSIRDETPPEASRRA